MGDFHLRAKNDQPDELAPRHGPIIFQSDDGCDWLNAGSVPSVHTHWVKAGSSLKDEFNRPDEDSGSVRLFSNLTKEDIADNASSTWTEKMSPFSFFLFSFL